MRFAWTLLSVLALGGWLGLPAMVCAATAPGPSGTATAQHSADVAKSGDHEADGGNTEQQAAALLREAARRTSGMGSLYVTFTQEKHLAMLQTPLVSSGYMCLERGGDAGESMLWAYEKPTPSGFAREKGQSWLWVGEGAPRRQAQGAEAAALKAVTAQILDWVHIRPEDLEKQYRMERVGKENTLRLTPRQSAAFFTSLEVTLAPGLDTVQRLRFVEKSGDSTQLTFHDARVNAPLPPRCQPPRPQQ